MPPSFVSLGDIVIGRTPHSPNKLENFLPRFGYQLIGKEFAIADDDAQRGGRFVHTDAAFARDSGSKKECGKPKALSMKYHIRFADDSPRHGRCRHLPPHWLLPLLYHRQAMLRAGYGWRNRANRVRLRRIWSTLAKSGHRIQRLKNGGDSQLL